MPETGNAVGQVVLGIQDRIDNSPDDEAWRHVIVPYVDYMPDLAGTSRDYTIRMFAAFYITSSPQDIRSGKGQLEGYFEHWMENGPWSDEPTGPLYLETAVLTE
jgi:hypothetical protein